MDRFKKIFSQNKVLIGALHVKALPGTPRNKFSLEQILEKVLEEAKLFEQHGYDGVIIENMFDRPYINGGHGPETTAFMTRLTTEVVKATKLKIGIQILSTGQKESLAAAYAAGANFVRVEGFVFSHIGDEGPIHSCAGDLLRFQKSIGADDIAIFTDIKKKHASHAITADVDLKETAEIANFFLSDGLIISGPSTGHQTDVNDLKACFEHFNLPVFVGSGVNENNLADMMKFSNAIIVGSSIKQKGDWSLELDPEKMASLSERFHNLL